MLKIATWNVNSLRVRLPHVLAWLEKHKPDVLALQELKIPNDVFPYDEISQAGYHAVASGQKTYNGVAILTKTPATNICTDFADWQDAPRRLLAATISGIRVINIYVPNGEDLQSEKYLYKLNWLQAFIKYLQTEIKTHQKVVVLGDFNIAPADIDVHHPEKWTNSVLCLEAVRDAFQDILKLGLNDSFRELHPDADTYSWWDYRLNAFKRNLGLRIDHILTNNTLFDTCQACYIDVAPRQLERPSDHTPVVAEFV